jgi:hypothetical protein
MWATPEHRSVVEEMLSHTSFSQDFSVEKFWAIAHLPEQDFPFWGDNADNLEGYFEEAKSLLSRVVEEVRRV